MVVLKCVSQMPSVKGDGKNNVFFLITQTNPSQLKKQNASVWNINNMNLRETGKH